jgi:hypothetical protein
MVVGWVLVAEFIPFKEDLTTYFFPCLLGKSVSPTPCLMDMDRSVTMDKKKNRIFLCKKNMVLALVR